jgi:Mg-chelatase subunit ChlD
MGVSSRSSRRYPRLVPTFALALLAVAAAMPGCGSDDSNGPNGGDGEGGEDAGGAPGKGGSSGKGGTAGSAGSSGKGGQGGSANGGESSAGEGGAAGAVAGLAYPLTLTPIGNPNVATAHVSLYFTATDANDEPVPGLVSADFVAQEDTLPVDALESAFRVTHPEGSLVIPTVLLLDLSRSVVTAGALEQVKSAADLVIDSLDPTQRLSILTFAESVTTRSTFTTDKTALHAAVASLTQADGNTTNLYGALSQSYGLWSDGFYVYDSTATAPQLVAGVMIVITDGNDTAAISTLDDVIVARGSRRTIFIRVGQEVDADIAGAIANAGVIDASGGFDDLDDAVDLTTERIAKLNDAIYSAEYCSPKRAGAHELFFTVEGNLEFVGSGMGPGASCAGSGTGPSCDGVTNVYCGADPQGINDYVCCAPEYPFMCGESGYCYRTAEAAEADCGASCLACGVATDEPTLAAGVAIEVPFQATGFTDAQCTGLFEDIDNGTGGQGGATGAGGGGGAPGEPTQSAAMACESFLTVASTFCDSTVTDAACVRPISMQGDCMVPSECETEFVAWASCLQSSITAGDAWSCIEGLPVITCGDEEPPCVEQQTAYDACSP